MGHPTLAKRSVAALLMDWPIKVSSPFYMDWLRAISGIHSPCSTGWPRTVREILTPSYIDKLN